MPLCQAAKNAEPSFAKIRHLTTSAGWHLKRSTCSFLHSCFNKERYLSPPCRVHSFRALSPAIDIQIISRYFTGRSLYLSGLVWPLGNWNIETICSALFTISCHILTAWFTKLLFLIKIHLTRLKHSVQGRHVTVTLQSAAQLHVLVAWKQPNWLELNILKHVI